MKNLKARTKLYKKFSHLPVKITDEETCIMINGKIVDIGRKCKGTFKTFKLAFCSDAQLRYFLSQQRNDKTLEFYGTVKDEMYFVHGYHKYTQKGSLMSITKRGRQADARKAGEMLKDNCFTGKHRSGDNRQITAAIKIPKKFTQEQAKEQNT